MIYPDLKEYPLVELLNTEIQALDTYRSKKKLAQKRSRARRRAHVYVHVSIALWVLSLLMIKHDLQMLFIAPVIFSLVYWAIDTANYDIPKLKYDADRAKSVYEISLEQTLGHRSAD